MTLLSVAASFLVGVLLADRYDMREPALGLFLLASSLFLALLLTLRRSPVPALLLALMLIGMLRVEVFDDDRSAALGAYHSRLPIQVQGVVTSDPERVGAAERFRFDVGRVRQGGEWEAVSGEALVTARESAALARQRVRPYFRYGDRLLLEGDLEAPPELEDFDYPGFLARQGIGSVMSFPEVALVEKGNGIAFYRWLYGVRRRLADSLAAVVPEPQASLGQALLLGLRQDLPEETVEDFRATGTSHVLAISGLHLGILLGISLAVSQRILGRRRQLYLIVPFVLMWLYALISGMSPSVTRAAIMGSVYLAALLLGRPRSILPALGLAAAMMVALSPNVLWSVSFQLSFAAMAGIALLAEPLSQWFHTLYEGRLSRKLDGKPMPLLTPLSHITAMTVVATLATLPLIAFYSNESRS